jgi:hypothetical protein
MKAFYLEKLALSEGGEYVLGKKDLHSQACYMIYGVIEPGAAERVIRPGIGYEEILCAVGGALLIRTPKEEIRLERGTAIHVREDESFMIANPGNEETIYIIAGGRSGEMS